ncbi:MAG: cheA1 [Proteobacteria bacterium]|nr:cheA1 [Pseudomonadota bacterium]
MDELTGAFIQEGREQLAEMEQGLLKLEQSPGTDEEINAIFRAAHTIKGASGVIECPYIGSFMHLVENILDRLRTGDLSLNGDLVGLLLRCCDHLGVLIDVLASGAANPNDQQKNTGDALLDELAEYNGSPKPGNSVVEHEAEVESSGGGVFITDSWHISVRFGLNVLRGGMDPLSFLRYLASLGEILHITTLADAMPAGDEMDPESCYLGFEIRFQSRASKNDIERVFEFVRDECELRILPPNSKVGEYLQLIEDLPEDSMRIGEMLVRCGALTQSELDEGLVDQMKSSQASMREGEEALPPPPLGEILVEHKVVQKEVVEAAISKQSKVNEKKTVDARLIRVQADKLDQLINLVGELVIAGASANLQAQKTGISDLMESTSVLSRLVEDIRDSALQLRMVQIGETFSRFNRVVRDVTKELGKEIELVITGADTELDKTVVEKIGDPLMHLVRNAIDHGIEAADVREAHGKSRQGRLELNSFHDSGSIVIEVRDDGGGINREKVLKKAIERGLVQPGQSLTDQETLNLIFEPGFSTADQVTSLSGRGVGMDVVRRNIQSLRGTVDVVSHEGEGSTFTIRLPLTLAIIDGFLVSVGKAAYVIPLDMVIECIELKENTNDRDYLNLRGEVLPFVRLRQMFEIEGEVPPRENIVVVQYAGQKAGIVVDELLGEFQTVIKPLSSIFRHLRGIGGSTILGSGDVALILDVQSLVQHSARIEEREMGTSALLRAAAQN